MKKKILAILLCGVILLGITGCGSNNTFDIGSKSDIEISNNVDVSLSIKEETLDNTGVTLILENNSDKLLRYDEVYEIEVKKDDKWHKINVELYFNEPLWGVNPKSKDEIDLNWEYGYGKLTPGEYRIIKEVFFESDSVQEPEFYIAAEFAIE